jgi:plastocyanin
MMRNRLFLMVALAFAIAAVGCGGGGETTSSTSSASSAPAAPAAPTAAPSGPTGSVAGVATYSNGDPDAVIAMDADPVCMSLHSAPVETEKVVAADGNLANVFVYVKEGLTGSFPEPSGSKVLDQNGCQYKPHVSGIQVGQTLVIRNSDETLHNVHALPSKNSEFNNGQPFKGMELEHTFDTQEVMVPFKCDVHPWMNSYIGVVTHPFFAVTGTDGSFSIEGLPVGDYVLEAWHEQLGTKTMSVSVTDGGTAAAAFDFSPAG